MLQKLGDHIKACLDRAAEADALAAKTEEPTLKAELTAMAMRWLHLSRSYEYIESLERSLLDSQNTKGARTAKASAIMQSKAGHPFIYRCPTTGLNVQGLAEDHYQAVQCLACQGVHLVNPATSNVLGHHKAVRRR
jgi:hypothetical protein